MIERHVFDNGLCLLTESMPDVRSVSLGAWLTRGSRHEGDEHVGIAHFAEHMLFKGTSTRTAEDIAQQVDSIGGQLDAFTAKECASYYIKVLDEHLPRAVDLIADLLLRPAFHPDDIVREKKVIIEEIKMVEDIPDDLVHELFAESFWPDHPLGRSILGSPSSVNGITADSLRAFFERAYVADNLVIAAAGNLEHAAVRDLIGQAFADLPPRGEPIDQSPPTPRPGLVQRGKEIEQSHLCLGTHGYPQTHDDRYACYVLNTVLGSSMSSRLFQNIREKRGLAYAVSSSLESYRDVGTLTIYAGCDAAAVQEVVALVVSELRGLRDMPMPADELQRAKDHLKGNLVLGLESTASRMSQLARSEIYFGRQVDLAENLSRLDAVGADDVQRVSTDLFSTGGLAATVLGPNGTQSLVADQLELEGV
jgi:predicted Zn-dependent peptidase